MKNGAALIRAVDMKANSHSSMELLKGSENFCKKSQGKPAGLLCPWAHAQVQSKVTTPILHLYNVKGIIIL